MQSVSDEEEMYRTLQVNLRIKPEDSYLFDGLTLNQTEDSLNTVTFYNELLYNIPLGKFLRERDLADAFVPVATFNHDRRRQENEFVAIVEGSHFPFFALAFAVERTQFNQHLEIDEDLDHSKAAVKLAQRFANLFVDEARLSGNIFREAKNEY